MSPSCLARVLAVVAVVAGCGGGMEGGDAEADGGVVQPGLLAFGSSSSTVTLAWTGLPGATGYTLERKSGGADYALLAAVGPEVTDYLDTGLAKGSYSYRLRATGDTGAGFEQTASPSDEVALRTEADPPVGEAVRRVVGAAGGYVGTDDGATTATFPAGAVPDGTEVVLQPIASPMGDEGGGVEVTVSAPLAGPMRLAFRYDDLDALQTGNLAVARKLPDGTWVAQRFELDEAARTATLVVSPSPTTPGKRPAGNARVSALVLRARAIEPRRAIIPPGTTLTLVAYAHFSDFACDRADLASSVGCQMLALHLNPRELLRPIREARPQYANVVTGYERDWLVEGAIGGSATYGRVVNKLVGADYTAPAVTPGKNPVDVSFTSVRVNGSTRTPEPPLHAFITIANPRWRGSLSCVVSASKTKTLPNGSTTTTLESSIAATAEDTGSPSAYSMKINSAQGTYTYKVISDTESGTALCPVHSHTEFVQTHTLNGADPSDLVALLVDDTRGEYMLTGAFGANLTGMATLTNTYTATGDPEKCPKPPPNSVMPSEFQPFWSCGGLGTFVPGSNEIHVDYTTHDQTDPPGTTHIKLDFKRQ